MRLPKAPGGKWVRVGPTGQGFGPTLPFEESGERSGFFPKDTRDLRSTSCSTGLASLCKKQDSGVVCWMRGQPAHTGFQLCFSDQLRIP